MKIVILCGGLGSRLSEETKLRPKPLVKIGTKPIVWHIMKTYQHYGFNNFILATGYKGSKINNYFKKNNSDKFNVQCVNTGRTAQTGARLVKLKKYLDKEENFMLTYGDGLINLNIKKLLNFHLSMNKIATITAVYPPVRFGELQINKNFITDFKEKAVNKKLWISGGYFVFNKKIFDFLSNHNLEVLETNPIKKLIKNRNLVAYKHKKFWQCMDTLRDKNYLNKLWYSGYAEWKKW
jgi:glucose-1-phosphate cytidylyltransferase